MFSSHIIWLDLLSASVYGVTKNLRLDKSTFVEIWAQVKGGCLAELLLNVHYIEVKKDKKVKEAFLS